MGTFGDCPFGLPDSATIASVQKAERSLREVMQARHRGLSRLTKTMILGGLARKADSSNDCRLLTCGDTLVPGGGMAWWCWLGVGSIEAWGVVCLVKKESLIHGQGAVCKMHDPACYLH